jgi:hypothetical protein
MDTELKTPGINLRGKGVEVQVTLTVSELMDASDMTIAPTGGTIVRHIRGDLRLGSALVFITDLLREVRRKQPSATFGRLVIRSSDNELSEVVVSLLAEDVYAYTGVGRAEKMEEDERKRGEG